MKRLKAYFKLFEYFGFINATKLILICRSDKWQLYNWWLYNKSIQAGRIKDSLMWECKVNWHIPNKEDFKDVEKFIKEWPY
jgi:hypothetical protein